jgi:hypothetical protein
MTHLVRLLGSALSPLLSLSPHLFSPILAFLYLSPWTGSTSLATGDSGPSVDDRTQIGAGYGPPTRFSRCTVHALNRSSLSPHGAHEDSDVARAPTARGTQVRNPWGSSEWTGDFSRTSPRSRDTRVPSVCNPAASLNRPQETPPAARLDTLFSRPLAPPHPHYTFTPRPMLCPQRTLAHRPPG